MPKISWTLDAKNLISFLLSKRLEIYTLVVYHHSGVLSVAQIITVSRDIQADRRTDGLTGGHRQSISELRQKYKNILFPFEQAKN